MRHLQVSGSHDPPICSEWPQLQYVLRKVKKLQDIAPGRVSLPVTAGIMCKLQEAWPNVAPEDQFNAFMLWAACCLGYFSFLGTGEFTSNSREPPAIPIPDVATDSHTSPSMVRTHLQRAKTDPLRKGIFKYLGRTQLLLCPVVAVLNYLVDQLLGQGPLFIHGNCTLLTRKCFVTGVKAALTCVLNPH